MNTIVGEITTGGGNVIQWIQDFFGKIGIYRWLRLGLYIIFIIILIIRLYYSNKTFQKVNTLFRVSIDNLYYEVSKLLYEHKDDIHDFKENIPLLLQYKTQTIAKKEKGNYYEDFNNLITEIEYISQLTIQKSILSNKDDINNQYTILMKLINTIKVIRNTITIVTLGISKLFI